MEEPITMPKRGRGRPKGSKNTKPSKPYERKAFSYTPEQAALVKYILRQDKGPSKRRMDGLKERMRTLCNSQPPIPADRMEELEATYAEQCKLHQSWLVDREIAETEKRILIAEKKAEKERKVKDASQQKRKPKKRVPAGIRTDLLQQINSEEHRQIKQLLFQGLGISDNHKTSKVTILMKRASVSNNCVTMKCADTARIGEYDCLRYALTR